MDSLGFCMLAVYTPSHANAANIGKKMGGGKFKALKNAQPD